MLRKSLLSVLLAAIIAFGVCAVAVAETVTVVISIETVVKMRAQIVGNGELSQVEYENLDLNRDSFLNIQDVVIARALVVGNMNVSDLPGYKSDIGNSGNINSNSNYSETSNTSKVSSSPISITPDNYVGVTIPDDYDEAVQKILNLVNKARAENGLYPYTLNETLCKAAQKRAKEQTQLFGHERPDGKKFYTVFDEFGLDYQYAGENVAAGQTTPERVMEMWLLSEGHRDNILSSNFTEIGIGYVIADDQYRYYWSQEFYHPMKYNVNIS